MSQVHCTSCCYYSQKSLSPAMYIISSLILSLSLLKSELVSTLLLEIMGISCTRSILPQLINRKLDKTCFSKAKLFIYMINRQKQQSLRKRKQKKKDTVFSSPGILPEAFFQTRCKEENPKQSTLFQISQGAGDQNLERLKQ